MSRVPRSLSRLRAVILLAALASAAALGACGDSDKSSPSTPAAAPSGPAGESKTNKQDASLVKLKRCLRNEGVNVPESGGRGAFSQLSPADRQQMQTAMEGPCRKYQSDSFGDISDPQSQAALDSLTKFAGCMRKNGVDFPDPVANAPGGPFAGLHSLDQSDPKISAAASACRDKLAALNAAGG